MWATYVCTHECCLADDFKGQSIARQFCVSEDGFLQFRVQSQRIPSFCGGRLGLLFKRSLDLSHEGMCATLFGTCASAAFLAAGEGVFLYVSHLNAHLLVVLTLWFSVRCKTKINQKIITIEKKLL